VEAREDPMAQWPIFVVIAVIALLFALFIYGWMSK
jgi:DNA-binding transcriptional regulator of glucitol operon